MKLSISIRFNLDIDKTLVANKLPFGKQDFEYFIGYKDDKKLDLYAYFVQKWVFIIEI